MRVTDNPIGSTTVWSNRSRHGARHGEYLFGLLANHAIHSFYDLRMVEPLVSVQQYNYYYTHEV